MRLLALLLLVVVITLLGGVTYFHSEFLRVKGKSAGVASRLAAAEAERDSRGDDLVATMVELATARDRVADLERTKLRLEGELRAEIGRRRDVDALIEKTGAALRAERERHNRKMWEAKQFMPEGVRQALIAIRDCLRADGQVGLRFLKARSIEHKVMHGVQLLDREPSTLASRLYIAEEMTFELDRSTGTMRLCLKGGYSSGPAGHAAFPAAGRVLSLPDVDGRNWEVRLPYLVRATGDYPVAKAKTRASAMGVAARAGWKRRINDLLATAKTSVRYKLDGFRDLENGRFLDALLVAYDTGKKLAMSAEAERLWVHVDDGAATVELRMEQGILHKRGGDTAIPAGGHRILLRGVAPQKALDLMVGMVIRR